MAKQGKSERFRKKYSMLDEIVGAMQKVGDIKDILDAKRARFMVLKKLRKLLLSHR